MKSIHVDERGVCRIARNNEDMRVMKSEVKSTLAAITVLARKYNVSIPYCIAIASV
jgi:hypothetical protein